MLDTPLYEMQCQKAEQLEKLTEDKSYAGHWEFPGGKLETNETPIHAIIRELQEELGIIVEQNDCSTITRLHQNYNKITIELIVMLIKSYKQQITALENQELYWHNVNTPCALSPLLPTTNKILLFLKNSSSLVKHSDQ